MKMSMYLNIARIAFYGFLAGLAWQGDIPWYVPVGWFIYDLNITFLVPIPFSEKWYERRMRKQYQQGMEQLLDQRQRAIPGPIDPKKWS